MSNEKNSFWDKKKAMPLLLLILTITMIFVYHDYKVEIHQDKTIQPATAQFVISSWAYPDEYGQGIRNVAIEQYTNETWVPVNIPSPPRGYYYDPNVYEITNGEGSNGSLWIVVQCYLNSTLCGIADINDGPALIRHTLTVTNLSDSIVFYQENFTLTYQTDFDDPLYFYQYEVFTDFVPVSGEVYTATVTYEVYY